MSIGIDYSNRNPFCLEVHLSRFLQYNQSFMKLKMPQYYQFAANSGYSILVLVSKTILITLSLSQSLSIRKLSHITYLADAEQGAVDIPTKCTYAI